MNGAQKSVTAKIAWAPMKIFEREEGSSISASAISIPWALRAEEAADEALRVTPRMRQSGFERKARATEPPWSNIRDAVIYTEVLIVDQAREKAEVL
jgi:hypothetical protein